MSFEYHISQFHSSPLLHFLPLYINIVFSVLFMFSSSSHLLPLLFLAFTSALASSNSFKISAWFRWQQKKIGLQPSTWESGKNKHQRLMHRKKVMFFDDIVILPLENVNWFRSLFFDKQSQTIKQQSYLISLLCHRTLFKGEVFRNFLSVSTLQLPHFPCDF